MQKFILWITSLFAITSNSIDLVPVKTPFPFEDLTIPYLQNRKYESRLNELKKHEDKNSYTSYLTSYNSEGLNINGLLTIPKDNNINKFPAIVFVHGYIPPSLYKTTERYKDYVDYLASNGFVVFKIDLRGHGSSGGEAGGAYYSSDYVIDTLNAYSALENTDFVDKDKIYLWGHSMAGNVVFRSLVVKKSIPKVVIWAGAGYTYNDLLEYKLNDQSYRPPEDNTNRQKKRKELRDKYGEFNDQSDFWKQVVPTNYLDGVKTKISLFHAVDDNVVSIEYSRNLKRILDEKGITNELTEYPSGGHNITGTNFTRAMQKTMYFFDL